MARLNHHLEHESGEDGDRPWPTARIWGAGEDPLTWWCFTLMKLGRLRVRVHIFLVPVWLGIEMLAWLPKGNVGAPYLFACLGALLVLALLHEVGRGLFARWLGDGGDMVVMWPLGGLNPVARRGAARPVLAEFGGWLVNAMMVPVLAGAALACGVPAKALAPNLLNPLPAMGDLHSVLQLAVWSGWFMNLLLLGLNLVPMLPMDGGRVYQALLRRAGRAGIEVGARTGFACAAVLFLGAVVVGNWHIAGVAAIGAAATLIERRRQEFVGEGFEAPPRSLRDELLDLEESAIVTRHDAAGPRQAARMAAAPVQEPPRPRVVTQAEALDRVLEKISRQGIGSLTAAEQAVLARETERRRKP